MTPAGKVLPCHAAESIPGLEFWSVREHSLADIWANSPAFNAFRGTAWMREPCRSCARREIDFGGCRCQAFALTGDARAADPVCHLAPGHDEVAALAAVQARRALRLPADVNGFAVYRPFTFFRSARICDLLSHCNRLNCIAEALARRQTRRARGEHDGTFRQRKVLRGRR